MANPWFRMYAEFAIDPKVQMMSEADQRRFIMLLCLRCSNGDVTLHDEEVAFQLRVNIEDWQTTKERFIEKGLIDDNNQPVAWNKRQFLSDSSAARVRRHRAKKKKESKRPCNVTVTPPDTDTDTDINTLSGGPDATKPSKQKAEAKAVLAYLNEKTGRYYRPVPANLDLITARIRDGTSADQLKTVIDVKASQWMGDPSMAQYLRPSTLFNRTKFEQYIGQVKSGKTQALEYDL